MSTEQLAAAVQETAYLERFTRREYDKAFREYADRFGPLYLEALRSAGEEGLVQVAADLMTALEAGWRRQRIWNRTKVQTSEKQMVVVFLSPMLLELEEQPAATELAKALRDVWGARRPKDSYRIASRKKLASGFRNAILGIDVSGFLRRKEQETEDEDIL